MKGLKGKSDSSHLEIRLTAPLSKYNLFNKELLEQNGKHKTKTLFYLLELELKYLLLEHRHCREEPGLLHYPVQLLPHAYGTTGASTLYGTTGAPYGKTESESSKVSTRKLLHIPVIKDTNIIFFLE